MKICYFGNTNSLHLKMFVKYFVNQGHIVHTFGRNYLDYGRNHFHHNLNMFRKITKEKKEKYQININRKKSKKTYHKNNLSLLKRYLSKVISYIDKIKIKLMTRKIKPDIVHGHEASAFGELTATIGDYPKILTIWGSDVFRFPWESTKIYKKVKKSLENVDIIHVTNPNTKDFIKEKFGINDKFKVIPWGIELGFFNKKNRNNGVKKRISNKLNIHNDDIILLYPKGFRDKKKQNYITLLEAFSSLSDKYKKLKLILISYGYCTGIKEVEEIISKKSLENRVYIEKDFISLEEMAEIYNMSDLCFVIEDTDELSLAVLESMACKCVPILSDISAYKRIFKEYDNCLYVNQKDSNSYIKIISKYIEEKEKIKNKMINNNLKLVENDFNRELQMPKIMNMYNKVIMKRCQ